MTLKQCTKEDLIWIIDKLCQMALGDGEYYLNIALNDLQHQKNIKRIHEADRYAKLAAEKRREYAKLLEPYEGKSFFSIPMEICKKADKLMEEAQKADMQWRKLTKQVDR